MEFNQKTFGIIFIVVTLAVVGYLGISNLNKSDNSSSPIPVSNQLDYNTSKTPEPPAGSDQKQMKQYSKVPEALPVSQLQNKKAVIVTNKGTIEFEILPEAPQTASNFIFLASDKFYDGLIFHRVVPKFVIQGGDPQGDGTGGPGYKFADEKVSRSYDKGIVAMANSGPNTNGSQFFIMLENNPLPPSYTIFGKVISGQEVVDQIQMGDVMQTVTIQPLQ